MAVPVYRDGHFVYDIIIWLMKKKNYLPRNTWVGIISLVIALVFTIPSFIQMHAEGTDNTSETKLDPLLHGDHPHVTKTDRTPISVPNQIVAKGRGIKLPILMYHHVGFMPEGVHDPLRAGLTVLPDNFEQQVKWLKSQNYVSVSLDDIYQYSQKQKQLPKKAIVFTFDDGYDDVFNYAIPILNKYGYNGSFGIITDFVGTKDGTNSYATWQQISAAKDQGEEVVCHTENHFDGSNPKFNADYIFQNLSNCQQTLNDHLQSAPPYLIYPYGHYTPVYIEQAKKAGFVMALTVHEGQWLNLENLFELPRIRVNGGEGLEEFEKILSEN